MRIVDIILLSSIAIIVVLSSCDRKVAEKIPGHSASQIESIMESVHEPIEVKGRVDYVREISRDSLLSQWIFDKKGNIVKEKKYNSRGAVQSQSIFSYDKKSRLIEVGYYQFKDLVHKTSNTYDSLNRLVENKTVDPFNKLKEKRVIHFDDKGYRIEKKYKLIGENLVLEQEHFYNPSGNNTENRSFSNSKLLFTEFNDFDKNGNRVECIHSSGSGKEDFIIQFKYDKLNRNIETIRLNSSFMIQSRMIYKYDEHDHCIERFSYGTTGKLREHLTWLYEYDEAGNWIRKTTFVGNHPVSVTVRDIIYYE